MTDVVQLHTVEKTVKEKFVDDLEKLLDRMKRGEIEGYSIVYLSDKIVSVGWFEDRLRMVGALHMAMNRAVDIGHED